MIYWVLVYLLTIVLTHITSRWSYRKQELSIAPLIYFVPIFNIITMLLCIALVLSDDDESIFSSKYWENRWNGNL